LGEGNEWIEEMSADESYRTFVGTMRKKDHEFVKYFLDGGRKDETS